PRRPSRSLGRTSMNALRLSLPIWALLVATPTVAQQESPAPTAEQIEFFEKRVRPGLVERCYECHSERAKKLKGGLFLDTRERLLKGGDSGPSIVAGDPEKSRIVKAIRWGDENLQMPPKGKLSDEQIADLEAWIRMGAPSSADYRSAAAGRPDPPN